MTCTLAEVMQECDTLDCHQPPTRHHVWTYNRHRANEQKIHAGYCEECSKTILDMGHRFDTVTPPWPAS